MRLFPLCISIHLSFSVVTYCSELIQMKCVVLKEQLMQIHAKKVLHKSNSSFTEFYYSRMPDLGAFACVYWHIESLSITVNQWFSEWLFYFVTVEITTQHYHRYYIYYCVLKSILSNSNSQRGPIIVGKNPYSSNSKNIIVHV